MQGTKAQKMDLIDDLTQESDLHLHVHDRTKVNYDKSDRIVKFFAHKTLSKFQQDKDWDVEVWIDEFEKRGSLDHRFSCGITIKRPRKKAMYVKKFSNSVNNAVKESMYTISNLLIKEGNYWKKRGVI